MDEERSNGIRSHRDLVVWQKAMDLVDTIYDLAAAFPPEEVYALRSQITRAAVSVPFNITEGRARATSRDFANFLVNARASLAEIDTALLIAVRRQYITAQAADDASAEAEIVGKMINKLRSNILERRRKP